MHTEYVTVSGTSGSLTLEALQTTIREFRARHPEPHAWIHHLTVTSSSPFMDGPLPVTQEQLYQLVISGYVEYRPHLMRIGDEAGQWWFSDEGELALAKACTGAS